MPVGSSHACPLLRTGLAAIVGFHRKSPGDADTAAADDEDTLEYRSDGGAERHTEWVDGDYAGDHAGDHHADPPGIPSPGAPV